MDVKWSFFSRTFSGGRKSIKPYKTSAVIIRIMNLHNVYNVYIGRLLLNTYIIYSYNTIQRTCIHM